MANKKTEKTFPKALLITDAISASVALESVSVDENGKPDDMLIITLNKGTFSPETDKRFQAAGGGAFGNVAAGGLAAIKSLLDCLKVHPDAYAVPASGYAFPEKGSNEPKEAETFDDLSSEEQAEMREGVAAFSADVMQYREAENKSRAATRTVAKAFSALMSRFTTKKRAGIFQAYCKAQAAIAVAEKWPNAGELTAVADIVTSKNVPAELRFFAAIPDDLLALMPEGKNGPKAAQAWINGMRSALADAIVNSVKAPNGGEGEEKSTTALFWDGVDNVKLGTLPADSAMLLKLHCDELPSGGLFDVSEGGKIAPAKKEGGKGYVSESLFGSEGADELLKSFCGLFNGYRTESEKEADKAAREVAKPLASRDFVSLSAGDVALHLFRIIAGRIVADSEETLSASTADCAAIVALLGDMVERIATGAMTVDDVINPKNDAPATDAEATADADAAA